jgi:AcrR family transcriptional regulator
VLRLAIGCGSAAWARTQIIEAAIGQLAARGDSGATFARIAAAGGLSSPGLISYHFADRGELLESVYRHVAELRRAANDRALAGVTDPAGRLRAALRADTELFAARPELFAAVVEAFHGLRDPAGRLRHLGEARSEERMLELLRAAAAPAPPRARRLRRPRRRPRAPHPVLRLPGRRRQRDPGTVRTSIRRNGPRTHHPVRNDPVNRAPRRVHPPRGIPAPPRRARTPRRTRHTRLTRAPYSGAACADAMPPQPSPCRLPGCQDCRFPLLRQHRMRNGRPTSGTAQIAQFRMISC